MTTDTRRESLNAISGRIEALERGVLRSLAEFGPMTPDECAEKMGETPFSIRPRFTNLRSKGFVARTGERKPNASGCNAFVCRLTGKLNQGKLL